MTVNVTNDNVHEALETFMGLLTRTNFDIELINETVYETVNETAGNVISSVEKSVELIVLGKIQYCLDHCYNIVASIPRALPTRCFWRNLLARDYAKKYCSSALQ